MWLKNVIFVLTLISILFYSNLTANYILSTFQLEYSAINKTSPKPVQIYVLIGTSVFQGMTEVARQNNRYEFGGTYYSDKQWLIEKYDNVSNNLDTNYCWYFYVKTEFDKQQEKPDIGVSYYLLTVNDTFVTFNYELDKVNCSPPQSLEKGIPLF